MTDKINPNLLKEKIFNPNTSSEQKNTYLNLLKRLYPSVYDQINSQPIQKPTEPPVEPQTPKVNNPENKLTEVYAFRLPTHQIQWLNKKFGKNKSEFIRNLIERRIEQDGKHE